PHRSKCISVPLLPQTLANHQCVTSIDESPSPTNALGTFGTTSLRERKMKKTARLTSGSIAFDGRVLLGLDKLGLVPVSQQCEGKGRAPVCG
ncbi:hypothetical protein, partial [Bifidobacterium sp. UTBIF-78]|uniref:hypothetical protein n=1 Tax=Bifidobacterium sp. UTBIF-78 TaxID=1465263 RepID=UPI001C615283